MPATFAEAVGPIADTFEREADRVAAIVARGPQAGGDNVPWAAATATAPRDTIQRAPRSGPGAGAETAAAVAEAPAPVAQTTDRGSAAAGASREITPAEPASQTATEGLIVDDEAKAGEQQLRKTEFLAALRVEVCAAVDGALAGTGRDSQGCPWIDHWLGYYEGRTPAQMERSLFRYAPEARTAKTARGYIPFVAARVRLSAERFATTGEISGVPQDVPGGAMAGGGMLAAFGGMFFKARPGGAHAADPMSVRAQLGGGQPLSGAVRGRMEPAFGANFAGVRVHTDAEAARLSNQLNARAFTIGEHVAFGGGEFQPGTIAGDALIAHELAHVVQQGHSEPPVGPLHKGGQPYTALEHDADAAATGVVTSLWSGVHGRTADLRRTAMPRLRSGLRLQRCGGSNKKVDSAKAGEGKGKLSAKEVRDSSIQEANTKLREVNTWAQSQVTLQNVKDKGGISAVKNLDPKQAENVAAAVRLLEKAQSLYGIKELEGLTPKLDDVSNLGKEAARLNDQSSQYASQNAPVEARLAAQQSQLKVGEAVDAASAAAKAVTALSRMVDVSNIAGHVDAIVTTLNGIQAGKLDISSGIDAVRKNVKDANKQVLELSSRYAQTPEAIGRIVFVLKSFLALNAPKLTSAPTAEDVKKYKDTISSNLNADFNTVFGEGKEVKGFDVFQAYGYVLEAQLQTRAKMEERGGKPASPIPSQGDAEAYFTALAKQPNEEVLPAWTTYTTAYFYHRVLDSFKDLQVTSVSEFYKRDLTIFGTRPLVCTGYAMLGAHLLMRAGASLTNFRVVFHATDDDLRSGNLNDGHAVTEMTRKGKTFWVSNHLIASTLKSALDVAWHNPNAPVFQATAKDINAASDAVTAQMKKKTDQLKAQGAPKK